MLETIETIQWANYLFFLVFCVIAKRWMLLADGVYQIPDVFVECNVIMLQCCWVREAIYFNL